MGLVVSVHQAHYMPWLGYCEKIDRSDLFVVLDNVQYKKREFQNRNRIKTPNGELWLTVPVQTRGHYDQMAREVEIDNTVDWRMKHLRSLELNYRKAPYFDQYYPGLEILYNREWAMLCDLNVEMMRHFMAVLGIRTPVRIETELNILGTKTERIVNICRAIGADTYLSGSGAKAYLEEKMFPESGLNLRFQHFQHPEYNQLHGDFLPYMAVVDLLFNHGKESLEIIRRGGNTD